MSEPTLPAPPTKSILRGTKKFLGLPDEYDVFDPDVIMHINSVFFTLNQLGVGPDDGFEIEDDSALWSDYIGTDKNLSAVKSYVYLRVRLLFDPPTTSFAIESMKKQVDEFEWRLNVQVDPGKDLTPSDA